VLVIPCTVFASAVFVYKGDNWTAGLLVKLKRHRNGWMSSTGYRVFGL